MPVYVFILLPCVPPSSCELLRKVCPCREPGRSPACPALNQETHTTLCSSREQKDGSNTSYITGTVSARKKMLGFFP